MDYFVITLSHIIEWMMHESTSSVYFAEHGLPAPLHTPPKQLVEFVFVQKGWLELQVGNRSIRITQSQVACINAHHGNRSIASSGDFRYACVSFFVSNHPHQAVWAAMDLLEVRDAINPLLIDTCYREAAIALQGAKDTRSRALLKAGILRLLAHLPNTPTVDNLLSSSHLFRAQAVLYDHLSDADLTIDRVAKACGCSVSKISRLFQAGYGQTPNQYLIGLRLARARTLLRQTRLSIKEIASLCGFADPAYFSRCYTAKMGETPSSCRQ